MFYGEYERTLDNKGRLIIPAKFREVLRDKFVEKFMVTRGYEGCLFVFPMDQWKLWEQELRTHSQHSADPRAVGRMFYASACGCVCDKQGRIHLPENLLAYAGIGRDVIIIGISTRFEIWERERWLEYRKKEEKNFEARAEQLGRVKVE